MIHSTDAKLRTASERAAAAAPLTCKHSSHTHTSEAFPPFPLVRSRSRLLMHAQLSLLWFHSGCDTIAIIKPFYCPSLSRQSQSLALQFSAQSISVSIKRDERDAELLALTRELFVYIFARSAARIFSLSSSPPDGARWCACGKEISFTVLSSDARAGNFARLCARVPCVLYE
jgi:hypothetical protein